MTTVRLFKHLAAVVVAGAILLVLPACAGHKELRAPCSAQLSPTSFWSGSAYAADGCGPMIDINLPVLPTIEPVEN